MKKLFVVLAVLALVGGSASAQALLPISDAGSVTVNVARPITVAYVSASPAGPVWLTMFGGPKDVDFKFLVTGENSANYTYTFSAVSSNPGGVGAAATDGWTDHDLNGTDANLGVGPVVETIGTVGPGTSGSNWNIGRVTVTPVAASAIATVTCTLTISTYTI